MPSSNNQNDLYQKTQGRKLNVESHLREVLSGSDCNEHNPTIIHTLSQNNIKEVINHLNHMQDYCATAYDKAQGIKRYIKDDSLVRDARGQADNVYNQNKEAIDSWSWTMQVYNTFRAALLSAEYHNIHEDKGFLNNIVGAIKLLDARVKGYQLLKENELKTYNDIIVKCVSDIVGEDKYKVIKKEVDTALDCTGLMDTHYNISTLIEIDSGAEKTTTVISDIKMEGLNEELRSELNKLSKKDDVKSFNEFISKKSSEMILKSHHTKVIPTQFSRLVPGLRNAYMEIVYDKDLKEITSGYRSGSPAFLGEDSDKMTKQAVDVFTNQAKGPVVLHSLMTANPMAQDEQKAHSIFNDFKLDNISFAFTPVNIAKMLQGADIKKFEDIIKQASDKLKDKDLTATQQLCLKNIQEAQQLINSSSGKDYDIGARMRILVHDIKRGDLSVFFTDEEKTKIPEIITFCKSGKDRTGISFTRSTHIALHERNKMPNADKIINSGHQQSLTGCNGGTAGAQGIKGDLAPNMPDEYRTKGLDRSTAYGNVLSTEEENIPITTQLSRLLSKKAVSSKNLKSTQDLISNRPIEERKENLKEVINKFFSGNIEEYNPEVPEKSLNKLVDYHLTQYDALQGIKRYIKDDYLIRDAREQKIPEDKSYEEHAWKAQCYNFCRAAQLVLKYNNTDNHNLTAGFKHIIEGVEEVKTKEKADEFKRDLIWFIADELGEKRTKNIYNQIAKQLEIAINCSALDDVSYNVTTVMKIPSTEKSSKINGNTKTKEQTIIQSDLKIKGFNTTLLKTFETISKADEKTELKGELYDWYNKHDDFNKFIAREACKKIVKRNNDGIIPVLPTQFRDVIPGLKNAYLEIVDIKHGDSIDNVIQSYRSGLPAYKKDTILTKEALNSFVEDTGFSKIYMNSLLTADEKDGPSTLKKVLKDMKGSQLIELPLNIVRNMGARKVDPFDDVLKKIASSLSNSKIITDDAKKFIETDRLLPRQSSEIKKLSNNLVQDGHQELSKAVLTLVKCRALMNKRLSWRTYGSLDNNKLANEMQIVMHDIQNGALKDYMPEELKNKTAILTFCKSGKDRTGTIFQGLIDESLKRELGYEDKNRIIDVTINGGQQAYLAGAGGGTTAAFGIKNEGGLNTDKKYKNTMVTELATYGNRVPKYKKDDTINEIDDLDDIALDEAEHNENSSINRENSASNQSEDKNGEISDDIPKKKYTFNLFKYFNFFGSSKKEEETQTLLRDLQDNVRDYDTATDIPMKTVQTNEEKKTSNLNLHPFSPLASASSYSFRRDTKVHTDILYDANNPIHIEDTLSPNDEKIITPRNIGTQDELVNLDKTDIHTNEIKDNVIVEQYNPISNIESDTPVLDNNSISSSTVTSDDSSISSQPTVHFNRIDLGNKPIESSNKNATQKKDIQIKTETFNLGTGQENDGYVNITSDSSSEISSSIGDDDSMSTISSLTNDFDLDIEEPLNNTPLPIKSSKNVETKEMATQYSMDDFIIEEEKPEKQNNNSDKNMKKQNNINQPLMPNNNTIEPTPNQQHQNNNTPQHNLNQQEINNNYTQPTPPNTYQNTQSQQRPPSPKSVADYDDDYYDRPYTPPQPHYQQPPQQEPKLTPAKIAAAVICCLLLSVLFGGIGFIFGIAIAATVIELSKPMIESAIPPQTYGHNKQKEPSKDRGRDIQRSQGHAKRVEKNRGDRETGMGI